MKLLVLLGGSAFSRQILPYLHRLFLPERFAIDILHVAQPPLPADAFSYPMAVGGDFSFYTYDRLGTPSYSRHPIYDSKELKSFWEGLEEALRDEARASKEAGYTLSSVHLSTRRRDHQRRHGGGVDLIPMMTDGTGSSVSSRGASPRRSCGTWHCLPCSSTPSKGSKTLS